MRGERCQYFKIQIINHSDSCQTNIFKIQFDLCETNILKIQIINPNPKKKQTFPKPENQNRFSKSVFLTKWNPKTKYNNFSNQDQKRNSKSILFSKSGRRFAKLKIRCETSESILTMMMPETKKVKHDFEKNRNQFYF